MHNMTSPLPTAAQIAREIGVAPRTKSCRILLDRVLSFAMQGEHYTDCLWPLANAVRGVSWSLQTGRTSGKVDLAWRAMSPYQRVRFLRDVAAELGSEPQGEVPYVIERMEKIGYFG